MHENLFLFTHFGTLDQKALIFDKNITENAEMFRFLGIISLLSSKVAII